MSILIITDLEGASGLRSEEEIDQGLAVKLITEDLSSIIAGIRSTGFGGEILIWDFDGNEDNLSDTFGEELGSYPIPHSTRC